MVERTQEHLIHHWGLDSLAAEALAHTITDPEHERIHEIADSIPADQARVRDANRTAISETYTRASSTPVLVEGPCSADETTNYGELFDVLEYVQDEHPHATIAVRINGKKPRTVKGWRGLAYSTNPADRKRLHEIHREGLARGRAIFSEITDGHELGEFAPYLSSFWLGALGMASTALRADASAYNGIPFAAKNSHDGNVTMVENTLLAARANTDDNEGSGVILGTIASGPDHRGIPTGVLPVGKGNHAGAIMARGYALPPGTSAEVGTRLALQHISDLCGLAKKLGTVVLIDKTHGAPQMIGLDRKNSNRILDVNETIYHAIEAGLIDDAEYIGGEVAEVSTETGRTDPNYIISWARRAEFSDMVGRAVQTALATHE